MTGHDSLGDDRWGMDNGSKGLGNPVGASPDDNRRMGGGNDRWGGDRADAMADGNTGETTGSGEGDSQDGNEDSLWKKSAR